MKTIAIVSILIIALIFAGCRVQDNNDDVLPEVIILYPYEGAVVSGQIIVSIESSDNEEIRNVWYYLDGELMELSNDRTPSFALDVSSYADDETHVFTAGAKDKNGNIGYSEQVTVIISDNDDVVPPTVEIVNPRTDQIVGDTVLVLASADDDTRVREVAFFINGDSLFSDPLYPYEYLWSVTGLADSTEHTIFAKAYDEANNWSVSEVVSVTVFPQVDRIPPEINLVFPVADQILSGVVSVQVRAADDQRLQQIEFYIDGSIVSTQQTTLSVGTFVYNWNTVLLPLNSQHTIFAQAIDASGNRASVGPVNVTVGSTDVTPPIITLVFPSGGQVVEDTVRIQAGASDDTQLQEIEFFIDGVLASAQQTSATTGTFFYDWDTTPLGPGSLHEITVRARDHADNRTSAGPINVTVGPFDNSPPVVTLLYPVPDDTLTGTVNVAVDVTDNKDIDQVEFLVDGVLINTDLDAPWGFSWNTAVWADQKTHTLYIRAVDEFGNVGTAGPLNFVIF